MLLSHRTSVNIRPEYSNIIGHMCYAASKLWNVCNYERRRYKELGVEKYPDWYRRKRIKESCGIDSFRPRRRRRPASSWIKPGNHFMSLKRPVGSKIQIRRDLNRTIYRSLTCRWESGTRKAPINCGCLCQRI